jgi:hypothetical protein
VFSVFYPTEISEQLTLSKSSGTVLQINRGAIKFWSSGAIELPNYTAFKDKELVTKEYVDSVSGSYQGEGLGVPDAVYVVTGTINQSSPVGRYLNALNDGSSRGNIELNNDEGYNEFQVIIQGRNKATREWRVGTGTLGKYSDKTIRMGETWQCRVIVDWDDATKTSFFWTRLDDGAASFEAIDTSGFDAVEPEILPLTKRFHETDLIEIPLELPEGFTVVVRQIVVKRSSGVELEMDFTYRHENGVLKIHTNEVGSGLIIAGIIKDEI